jgi:RsiW-degrading membrane proteinase PrsW (M82 family)
MNPIALLSLAIAPGLAIGVYVYWQDKFDKEPLHLLLLSFFYGMLSVIPAVLLSELGTALGFDPESSSLGFSLLSCVIGIGLVEEYSKYLFVRYGAYRRNAFNEPYDGITYSVMVSMGFATLENVLYVFNSEAEDGGGMSTGILRMFTAVPAHATFAIIIGYYLGQAKHNQQPAVGIIGLFLAALLHGVYDFFLFNSNRPGLVLGALLSLLIGLGYSRKAIRLHQQASPFNGTGSGNNPG